MKSDGGIFPMKYIKVQVTFVILGAIILFIIISCGDKVEKKIDAPAPGTTRIAGIMMRWNPGNRENNFRRAEKFIRKAAENGAKIICTPESFLDGYSIRIPDLSRDEFLSMAESIPGGKYISRLTELCRELGVYCIAGITERDGNNAYNSAVLIDQNGTITGKYRKKYLWPTEVKWYMPGSDFPGFMTEFGRFGMMICSDRREPQAIKELAGNGANIVFCLAGGGYGEGNDAMMQQRSIDGQVPIVFVHPLEFLVTGKTGEILVQSVAKGDDLDAGPSDGSAGEIHYFDWPGPNLIKR
jgi:predicted amidohydrolase